MDIILYILIFCIGAVFGSFFTLAVYRIPIRQDITHTRSYCPNCKHKLSFLDMIPILSYIFLGGKCRYCKQKIRIRYLLLEVFSGIIFVLFAFSIKLSLYTVNEQVLMYYIFGILYIATILIIAGIDKEKIKIEKPVLLFGFICVTIYMIYLYILEKDISIHRYVIYLVAACILEFINIIYLRKKGKDNYTIDILILSVLMMLYTYEVVYIYTVIITLLAIAMHHFFAELHKRKYKVVKKIDVQTEMPPIGMYMCTSNILMLIVINLIIFYA